MEQIPKHEVNKSEIIPLHRGVWASELSDGEMLPVGGSAFNDKLNIFLELDFHNFEEQLKSFTQEKILELYEKDKDSVDKWVELNTKDLPPVLFYFLFQVQQKMQQLLNATKTDKHIRREKYTETPKLSDLIGVTECAERAAMAQYLLQRLNIPSAYMSGVTADGRESDLENHSFIIINPKNTSGSFVFDVARPLDTGGTNIPAVYNIDMRLDPKLFQKAVNTVVATRNVWDSKREQYFGVGNPMLDELPQVLNHAK